MIQCGRCKGSGVDPVTATIWLGPPESPRMVEMGPQPCARCGGSGVGKRDVIRGDDEDPHRPVLQVIDHELERRAVLEQITTQPEHRETRREMYEGLHRIPTSGSTAVDSLGMLPGYTRRKTDEG